MRTIRNQYWNFGFFLKVCFKNIRYMYKLAFGSRNNENSVFTFFKKNP